MAIPTWRNVNAPSNTGANQLLSSAGNTVSQGISNITGAIGNYEDVQANNRAKQFQDTLSAGIGQFDDAQGYKDYVTQQTMANPNISRDERTDVINNAIAEREQLAGLTTGQQQQVAEQKAQDSQELAQLNYQQDIKGRQLESKIGVPLEQFDWANDDTVSIKDVAAEYDYLKDSGMNVNAIKDRITMLNNNKPPTGAELRGIMALAMNSDYSLFNANSAEITDWWGSKLASQSLTDAFKKYKADTTDPKVQDVVNQFKAGQISERDALTRAGENRIKDFTKQAGQVNIGVSRGNTRTNVNF